MLSSSAARNPSFLYFCDVNCYEKVPILYYMDKVYCYIKKYYYFYYMINKSKILGIIFYHIIFHIYIFISYIRQHFLSLIKAAIMCRYMKQELLFLLMVWPIVLSQLSQRYLFFLFVCVCFIHFQLTKVFYKCCKSWRDVQLIFRPVMLLLETCNLARRTSSCIGDGV